MTIAIEGTRGARSRSLPPSTLVIGGAAALSVGLLLFQALFHGHLSGIDEYDDGVYFGAAINLVHGVLPYRDFAFIQPPGIVLLLSPIAALSTVIGTAHAFELARLFVVAVSVLNVVMIGLLVRHRPALEVAVATGVMAIFPGMLGSTQSVLIEPFLVALCLAGMLLLFRQGSLRMSSRALTVAGLIFGMAVATKIWAIAPLLAVFIILHGARSRRPDMPHRAWFVVGVAGGFLLFATPFIIAAPGDFFSQVFVVQAIRGGGGYALPERLVDIMGLSGVLHWLTPRGLIRSVAAGILVTGVVVALASTLRKRWSDLNDFEQVMLLSAGFVAASLLCAPTYYYHYAGFIAPFIACVSAIGLRVSRSGTRPRGVTVKAFVVAAVAFGAVATVDVVQIARAPRPLQIKDALSDAIPANGCIFAVNPAVPILDNRYTSYDAGCPSVVDFLAQQRVLDAGAAQSKSDRTDAKVQSAMLHWLRSSDVLVLGRSNLPIDTTLFRYVDRDFGIDRARPEGMTVLVRHRNA